MSMAAEQQQVIKMQILYLLSKTDLLSAIHRENQVQGVKTTVKKY